MFATLFISLLLGVGFVLLIKADVDLKGRYYNEYRK